MKIYSWNVNGIRAVIKKQHFWEFINKHNPEIICLQEVKADRDQVKEDFKGYFVYWNSAVKKGYSGTAILSKTKPINVQNGIPKEIINRFDFGTDPGKDVNSEGRVLTAEYDNFILVNVYTPNTKDNLSRLRLRHEAWDPAFLAYCKELEKIKPVIFCGDLNVAHLEEDLSRPKENEGKKGFTKEERSGFDKFLEAGFVDTFRIFHQGNGYYSWWSHWARARERNIGWRIDYFLVSASLISKIIKADIHPEVMGSDHCPVSITVETHEQH